MFAAIALIFVITAVLQNSVLGYRLLGRQSTNPTSDAPHISMDGNWDASELYRSGCTTPFQDHPDGPYTIQIGTFPGDAIGRSTAESARMRLMAGYLPLDQSGRQICPIIQTELNPTSTTNEASAHYLGQDLAQESNLLLTLGGFASLENAYLYALELVLGSPFPSLSLSIDGFQILFDRQPIEIKPGDRKPEGLTPSLRTAVVVQEKAPVFRTPDSRLPLPSRAFALLSRGDLVFSGRTMEVCSNTVSGCLYWHQVIHGPQHRRGWMVASDLLDIQSGVECPVRGCEAEVFMRRIMSHSDTASLENNPYYLATNHQDTSNTLVSTSNEVELITFDMWLLQHGTGRGHGVPIRVGKLRIPESGFFSPDLRWRDNRPVLVGPEGQILWTGPAITTPPSRRHQTSQRLHTS